MKREKAMDNLIDQIKYNEKGLVPVIIQDYLNNEVLMLAYMNKEAFRMTLESGQTWFWSRSRQKYWQKGEHSGHIQRVKDVLVDCDNDTILIKVEQIEAACHAGYRSCFYRKLIDGEFKIFQEKVFNEKEVYSS
ncbi:MAG: phosphoribosyl-AMP cyclohydrolase [Desulfobacterota bacterium]|nr:phosphoribosyl-AMP cyclohydrolase [Thermodesulfobacteriota bacterium]